MNKKIISRISIALLLLLSQLFLLNKAHALALDFIDNGEYTTDTLSGLDWLDVTASVNQSYSYVNSQLGTGGAYGGWRYATGDEFNQMITNYTGIDIASGVYGVFSIPEGKIDNLHFLLGSTLDASHLVEYGQTYDQYHGYEEGGYHDYTYGIISDLNGVKVWSALIYDYDVLLPDIEGDRTETHLASHDIDYISTDLGSYLVRDTITAVPIPTSILLMGTAIFSLIGFSRNRKN